MEEKSEKPSLRKLKKGRDRGEVAKSGELAFALILMGGLLLLWGFSKSLQSGLQGAFTSIYSQLNTLEWEEAFTQGMGRVALPLAALLVALFVIALGAHLVQAGWVWGWSRSRKKGRPRFIFTLFKVVVIGAIGYLSLKGETPTLHPSPLFEKIYFLLLKVAVALLIMGIGDFIYQKWRYYQQMRMTPEEVKEEIRETEGNRETKKRMFKK